MRQQKPKEDSNSGNRLLTGTVQELRELGGQIEERLSKILNDRFPTQFATYDEMLSDRNIQSERYYLILSPEEKGMAVHLIDNGTGVEAPRVSLRITVGNLTQTILSQGNNIDLSAAGGIGGLMDDDTPMIERYAYRVLEKIVNGDSRTIETRDVTSGIYRDGEVVATVRGLVDAWTTSDMGLIWRSEDALYRNGEVIFEGAFDKVEAGKRCVYLDTITPEGKFQILAVDRHGLQEVKYEGSETINWLSHPEGVVLLLDSEQGTKYVLNGKTLFVADGSEEIVYAGVVGEQVFYCTQKTASGRALPGGEGYFAPGQYVQFRLNDGTEFYELKSGVAVTGGDWAPHAQMKHVGFQIVVQDSSEEDFRLRYERAVQTARHSSRDVTLDDEWTFKVVAPQGGKNTLVWSELHHTGAQQIDFDAWQPCIEGGKVSGILVRKGEEFIFQKNNGLLGWSV